VAGNSSLGTTGGKILISGPGLVPATTRLGIANGLFDIGSQNVTLSQLTFQNVADTTVLWNNTTGAAAAGVIASGGGTLTVTGEINVLGNSSGSTIQSIGANLNLGGGTQIIRTQLGTGISNSSALQIAGVISNGSLLKSYGFAGGSSTLTTVGNPDGMALYGNNTYTGSTTINGGNNIITGTNATTSVKVAGPGGTGFLTLQGANGSLGSATTVLAETGATFQIDNTAAVSGVGSLPNIPAAQNNNRIADNAEIQLRNGTFLYKGNGAGATETFGNLNILDGANIVTLTPTTGGSVALTAGGTFSMASRATLAITNAAATTLGGTTGQFAQLLVTGAAPATDLTGIVDRVYTGTSAAAPTDFVTYGANGFAPLAAGSYSGTFTAGTNVSNTGAQSVASSVNVNAIKSQGTGTTTIAASTTLGVTSGMLLSAGFGTRTYAGSGTGGTTGGSTLDFGSAPGVSFATNVLGTVANPIVITGSAGLINSVGTLTISAGDDLSGLTGEITSNGTTNLNTNTFGGTIQVRNGTFNINTSLGAGGAITIGIPENDSNLIGLAPSLNTQGAGANSSISRDIIFNNGGLTAAGASIGRTFQPNLTVLSNTAANGTQTFSGNITVDSPGFITGGSPTTTATGSTSFTGNVSGPSSLTIFGDRANFSVGNISNTGGLIIGTPTSNGQGTQVTLTGTTSGTVPIFLEDNGSNGGVSTAIGTQLRYNATSLPTGVITVENSSGIAGAVAQLVPLQDSTISNSIVLNSALVGNVGSGINAAWNGQMSGSITNSAVGASGNSNFTKTGTGTLTLGNASNTYTGFTTVSAGTLLMNGANASSSTTVQTTGTLGGNGNLSGSVTVNAGGTIAPGNTLASPGNTATLSTGALSLSGTYVAGMNLNNGGPISADLLNVTGAINLIAGSTLTLQLSNIPSNDFNSSFTFLITANDGSDAVNGTFSAVTGSGFQTATVDYGFVGTDALGRIGDGNDIAVTVQAVPEPQTYALLLCGAGLVLTSFFLKKARVSLSAV
jgi:autotransporter-associated beta strand protein